MNAPFIALQEVPRIPYEEHPSFAPVADEGPTRDLDEQALTFAGTVQEILRNRAVPLHDPGHLMGVLRDGIATLFSSLDERFCDPDFTGFLTAYAAAFEGRAAGIAALEERKANSALEKIDAHARDISTQLSHFGFSALALEDSEVKDWDAKTRHLQAALLAHHAASADKPSRQATLLDGYLLERCDDLLRSTGLLSAAEDYRGHDLSLSQAALRLDCPGMPTPFPHEGAELTAPSTAGLHLDTDRHSLTAVLYLSPVGIGTAPVCFLEGSHAWRRDPLSDLAAGVIDDLCPDSRTHLFDNTTARRYFMRLPRPLRHSSRLGDDLLEGSYDGHRLLSCERAIVSEDANLVLYDGGRGLHRTGPAGTGLRWSLSCRLA